MNVLIPGNREDVVLQLLLRKVVDFPDGVVLPASYRIHTHKRLADLGAFSRADDLDARYERATSAPLRIDMNYEIAAIWACMEDLELMYMWIDHDLGSMWIHIHNPVLAARYALPNGVERLLAYSRTLLNLGADASETDIQQTRKDRFSFITSLLASYTQALRQV